MCDTNKVACRGCGVTLTIPEGRNEVRCDYCYNINRRIVPAAAQEDQSVDEWRWRADLACNRLEFDEAEFYYRLILRKEPANVEALWGMIRCRYGVQYVADDSERESDKKDNDPDKRVHIMCARRLDRPVHELSEYLKLSEFINEVRAKEIEKKADRAESDRAKRLERDLERLTSQQSALQHLRIDGAAEDYDVFICSQDQIAVTDENGETIYRDSPDKEWVGRFYEELDRQIRERRQSQSRTQILPEIRVFYAPKSTLDHVGTHFASLYAHALFSARIMLVMGTGRSMFDSAWVSAVMDDYIWLKRTYQMERKIIGLHNRSEAQPGDRDYKLFLPPDIQPAVTRSFSADQIQETIRNLVDEIYKTILRDDPNDPFRSKMSERLYGDMRKSYAEMESKFNGLVQQNAKLQATVDGEENRRQTAVNEALKNASTMYSTQIDGIRETNSLARRAIEAEKDEALRECAALRDQIGRKDNDLIARDVELRITKENLQAAETNLQTAQEEIKSLKDEIEELRKDRRLPPPLPPLKILNYGFVQASEGPGTSMNPLGPDLSLVRNLKHPERIRFIAVALGSDTQMRVHVRLQHKPSEMDDMKDAVLRPKMAGSVGFPIDPSKLSLYDGDFQLTVTDDKGTQLIRENLRLKSAHL